MCKSPAGRFNFLDYVASLFGFSIGRAFISTAVPSVKENSPSCNFQPSRVQCSLFLLIQRK
jgi:hypothetical protein